MFVFKYHFDIFGAILDIHLMLDSHYKLYALE